MASTMTIDGGLQYIPQLDIQTIYVDFEAVLQNSDNAAPEASDAEMTVSADRVQAVISDLNARFAGQNIVFVAERPVDIEYSQITVTGDSVAVSRLSAAATPAVETIVADLCSQPGLLLGETAETTAALTGNISVTSAALPVGSHLIETGSTVNISVFAESDSVVTSTFDIDSVEKAFIAGIGDVTWADFKQNANGYSYTNDAIVDAEKSTIAKDDMMCWAAAAANMLYYSGWHLEKKKDDIYTEDSLFQVFIDNFTLGELNGGNILFGLEWFFVGEYLPMEAPGWDVPVEDSGAFYDESINSTQLKKYLNDVAFTIDGLNAARAALEGGASVGCSLGWYQSFDSLRAGGHAVTLWGFTYNTNLEVTDPNYYTGIIISDSDDNCDYESSLSAPDSLQHLAISYVSTGDTGAYYIDSDYTGESLAKLENLFILAPNTDKITPDVQMTDGKKIKIYQGEFLEATGDSFKGTKIGQEKTAAGDRMYVFAGGKAEEITIQEGGNVYLREKDAAISKSDIYNDGQVTVYAEAIAENITVHTGGSVIFQKGAILKGTNSIAGTITLNGTVTAEGSTISFNLTERLDYAGTAILNDLSLLTGKVTYTITVSDSQATAEYKLASGVGALAADFSIAVKSSVGTDRGTLKLDNKEVTATGADLKFLLKKTGQDLILKVTNTEPDVKAPTIDSVTPVQVDDFYNFEITVDASDDKSPKENLTYKLEYQVEGSSEWVEVKSTKKGKNVLNFQLNSEAAGKTCKYRISVTDDPIYGTPNTATKEYSLVVNDTTAPEIISPESALTWNIDSGLFTVTPKAVDNKSASDNLTYQIKYAKTREGLEAAVSTSDMTFFAQGTKEGDILYYMISATDEAGYTSWSDVQQLTLTDMIAPTIDNSSLSLTQSNNSYTFTASFEASDNKTLAYGLSYQIKYAKTTDGLAEATPIDGKTFTITDPTLDATYYYQVAVKDKAGNTAWSEVKEFKVTDATPPTISSVSVSQIAGTYEFKAAVKAADNKTAVSDLKYKIKYAKTPGDLRGDAFQLTDALETPIFTFKPEEAGKNWYYQVGVIDADGNITWSTAQTIFVSDVTAPALNGLPVAVVTNDQKVTISWNAAADNLQVAGYRLIIDGASYEIEANDATEYSCDLENLTIGSHTYVLQAYDKAGNVSASESQTFTISRPNAVEVYNGGELKSFGAILQGIQLNNADRMVVSSNGVVEDTQILTGGTMTVFEKGTAINTTVDGDAASADILEGATATGLTVANGGSAKISGTVLDYLNVSNGGSVEIGGTVQNLSISNGGSAAISGTVQNFINAGSATVGGTVETLRLTDGGQVTLTPAGTITGLEVASGAKVVAEGGTITGAISLGGTLELSGAVDAQNAYINFALDQRTTEDDYIINDLSLLAGNKFFITITPDPESGTYRLAEGAANFNKTITIGDGSSQFDLVVNGDAVTREDLWTYTLTQEEGKLHLNISVIDEIRPEAPIVIAPDTTPTNQNVTITAKFSDDSAKKEYSLISDQNGWQKYDPEKGVVMKKNGTVYFRGTDAAGNVSEVTKYTVSNIDKEPPETPVVVKPDTTPTNQNVTITATFSEDSVKKEYSLDKETWHLYPDAGVLMEANGMIYFRGTDAAGNRSAITEFEVTNIDKGAPEAPAFTVSTDQPTNQAVILTAVFDTDSVKKEYSFDNKTWEKYTESITVESNCVVYFRGTDVAGNVSETSYEVTNIDKTAPHAPIAYLPASSTTATKDNVTVLAAFSSDSVLKEYSFDKKNWNTYSDGAVMTANGTVYFRGTDAAGNVSPIAEYTVSNIDKTPPARPAITANITEITLEKVILSVVFGADSVKNEYSLDNKVWKTYTGNITMAANGTVYFRSTDMVGNTSCSDYTVNNIASDNLQNLASSSTFVSWEEYPQTAGYTVELSTDNFASAFKFVSATTKVDFLNLPKNTYQWRVSLSEEKQPVNGQNISAAAAGEPQQLESKTNGDMDIFFAQASGVWGSGYAAQHQGSNAWTGTKELVDLTGKNKISDTFAGSDDANILLLTDDANGDALFLEDTYTSLGNAARLSKITEIRAGLGNDIIDLTSQRYELIGSGVKVYGGDGDDVIWAGSGNNALFGDAGNDRLTGGSGNDVICGGSGNDLMHGGGGNDVFTFGADWGMDSVEQLAGGKVTLWFESGSSDNWDADSLTYTDGANSVRVSGVTLADVTLKFGETGSAAAAFLDAASEKIFEDKNKGMLA